MLAPPAYDEHIGRIKIMDTDHGQDASDCHVIIGPKICNAFSHSPPFSQVQLKRCKLERSDRARPAARLLSETQIASIPLVAPLARAKRGVKSICAGIDLDNV